MTRALMPRLKMPWWAAVGVPIAAYAIRSAVRGSLKPDLPQDAIVLAVLLAVLLLAALYRPAAQRGHDDLGAEVDDEHHAEGGGG